MNSSLEYVGKAFRKGDEVWVNFARNSHGEKRFMTIIPDQLRGRVDPKAYNEFMVDLEAKLEGKGGYCPFFLEVFPCLALPILPCLCAYLLAAKSEFEAIVEQTIDEHQHEFGNCDAVRMKLLTGGGGKDHEAATGYNIVFDLSGLPRPSTPAATSAEQEFVCATAVEPEERGDLVEKLKQLKDLLDAGAITQAEYEKKKAPVLERL